MVFNGNEHPKMIKNRNDFGDIKNNHAVLLCTETKENKKHKVVYFLPFRDMSFRGNDSISF